MANQIYIHSILIILTGGAGFIGSNILANLNAQGIEDIIVVDNLKNAEKHKNLNDRQFIDFIDKRDFLEVLPQLGRIEKIIHQGACSSTTEKDGQYMMKNNYEYSTILLEYSLQNGTDFLYASSAATYGNGERGFDDAHNKYFPLNIYAYSKLLFDRYVSRTIALKKPASQVLGLRYFNVYGYQENHKGDMASVPYKFFRSLEANEPIRIFEGSEKFFRDFIFIEDVISVFDFFLSSRKSGIYNCGTGEERSFQDIADNFVKLSEGKATIEKIPFPDHLKGKYQAFTKATMSNLRAVGYDKSFHSLEEGLKKYYQLLEEQDGYIPPGFQQNSLSSPQTFEVSKTSKV